MLLLSHTFADRDQRLDLIKKNVDRYFNLLEVSIEESTRIAKLLMYAARLHGCVRIDRGRGQWHYLHRSCRYGDDLQLTTWDQYGPVSDLRVRDASDFSYLMNGTVVAYVENDS